MSMTPRETVILANLEGKLGAMEDHLARLVAINSFSAHRDGVNAVGDELASCLAELGFRMAELVTGKGGRSLIARRPSDVGHRLLLLGHLDTVHPPGSPFRELTPDGSGLARGPGAADMKGGLVVIVHALRALHETGALEGRHLTVILNADEEIGSPGSAEIIKGEAADSHLGLCFEAGRDAPDGATTFVTGRRGFGRMTLRARGRAAHAGVDPGAGASAVRELCHQVLALEALSDPARGVSVNVGVFQGGTVPNTVPEEAAIDVDYRFPDSDAEAEVEDAIFEIAAKGFLRDAAGNPLVATTMRDQVKRPALARSEAMGRMAARIIAWGTDLGLPLVEESRGGSSDAAFVAEAGCPAICGLGAVGGAFHTDQEWVRLPSLQDRARLAALVISRFYEL